MENQNQEAGKKRKTAPRYMGRVIKWDKDRKYGFIRCYENGQNYFAHCTQLTEDYELVKGSVVEFEVWQSKQEPDKVYAAKILVCEVPERYNRRQ